MLDVRKEEMMEGLNIEEVVVKTEPIDFEYLEEGIEDTSCESVKRKLEEDGVSQVDPLGELLCLYKCFFFLIESFILQSNQCILACTYNSAPSRRVSYFYVQ